MQWSQRWAPVLAVAAGRPAIECALREASPHAVQQLERLVRNDSVVGVSVGDGVLTIASPHHRAICIVPRRLLLQPTLISDAVRGLLSNATVIKAYWHSGDVSAAVSCFGPNAARSQVVSSHMTLQHVLPFAGSPVDLATLRDIARTRERQALSAAMAFEEVSSLVVNFCGADSCAAHAMSRLVDVADSATLSSKLYARQRALLDVAARTDPDAHSVLRDALLQDAGIDDADLAENPSLAPAAEVNLHRLADSNRDFALRTPSMAAEIFRESTPHALKRFGLPARMPASVSPEPSPEVVRTRRKGTKGAPTAVP